MDALTTARLYDTLKLLIEQAPVGIAMFDREMRYLAVSQRWLKDFPHAGSELIGRSHYEAYPDAPEHWRLSHARALAGAVTKEQEDEWIRRDGTSQWLRWSVHPWKDTSDQVAGIIVFAEDITDRMKAERTLRETEERFHRMFDRMLEGCQIIGPDWRYRYANQSVAIHSRKKLEDLLGRTMMEAFSGFEGSELHAAIRDCMADKASRRLESRIDFRDGSVSWFDFSIQPSSEGIFILSTDISARKLAEATLHESEERYRRIVETANEGIWQVDSVERTVFVNRRMAKILGYEPEEMLGTSALGYFDASTLEQIRAHAKRRRQGEAGEYTAQMRRKDGTAAWLLIHSKPLYDEKGRYEGAVAMLTDVTDRKNAEALLQASEERFQRLTESLPQLIWTSDSNGRCDFLSAQWMSYTGVAISRLLGTGWLECVHPEDRATLSEIWPASLASSGDFHCEFRIRRADGKYRWFHSRATAHHDAQGHVTRWHGANTDIEDEKRARDAQARDQKMEALGTLAGGIAHDFNNLLTAITGNTSLALEDLSPTHPARESLHEIERASRRATDLVRRILAFSRQEEPRREVLRLQPVIEEALKLLRATVPAQIELRTRFDKSTPRTIGDATQVHQILMNLVTNAAYAIGDRPGSIEIGLGAATVDEEGSTSELRAGRFALLTIVDDGCGMDRDTMQRIFDPFFTTKPSGQGTGLGLSVVAGIMKTHGGAVTVYSEPGKGSAFRLYFPATANREKARAHEEMRAPPAARGQRVLYIDDDVLLVSLVTRKLTRLGYVVTGEPDPEKALAEFKKDPGKFDAVVTDLAMPRLRGFDLARELLAMRPDLPVIVVSGYVRSEDQETARSIGVREVILKPNTSDDLGAVLDELFKKAQPRASSAT